jgi:hypothetical protein
MAAELGAPSYGLRLIAPAPEKHAFARQFVDDGLARGEVSLGKRRLTLHLVNGDLAYKIDHAPGRHVIDGEEVVLNEYRCTLQDSPGVVSAAEARELALGAVEVVEGDVA